MNTGEIKQISRTLFSKLSYPVIQCHSGKVRLVGSVSRTEAKRRLCSMGLSAQAFLNAQGLFGTLVDAFKGLADLSSVLVGSLNKIGNLKKRDILMIISSFVKVADMFHSREFTPLSVTAAILDIYMVYSSFTLEAQSLESLASIACASFIPEKLFSVIRKSQYLSSVKILDDLSYFHDFLITIVEAFEWITDKIPFPNCMKSFINNMLETFRNTSDHVLIRDMEKILKQSVDCKVFLDLSYREKSKKLNDKVETSHALKEWTKRSNSLFTIIQKWSRHMKIIKAYEDPGRVEPTCFIFEGQPGKKKSVVMNAVVEALGEPFYAHCVKAVMDGKDFYDNYNNEPIFYMDDVGQNGVSQWRPLMNMVSSVKMPLDCAEASNKDTKFFNSSKIFATTNRFQTLNNCLTKQDCIDDIEALWRRGNIFDFSLVNPTSSFIEGRIQFKHFDLNRKMFVNDFPTAFKKEAEKRGVILKPYLDIQDRSQLLLWICKIIKIFDLMKRDYANHNRLTESEKSLIQGELRDLEFLDAESSAIPGYVSDLLQSLLGEFTSTIITYLCEIKNFIADNAIHLSGLFLLGIGLASLWWVFGKIDWHCKDYRYVLDVKDGIVKSYSVDGEDIYKYTENGMYLPSKPYLYNQENSLTRDPLFKEYLEKLKKKPKKGLKSEDFKFDPKGAHNSLLSIQKSVKNIKVTSSEGTISMRCLISGRSIILPSHATGDDEFSVIVFDDTQDNKRLIDGDLVKVVYRNTSEDVMVCKLRDSFPSPFKNMSKWFKEDADLYDSAYVVSSEILSPVGMFAANANLRYKTERKSFFVKDAFVYDLQFSGLCGSIIFSPKGGVLGMHVAGSDTVGYGVGMAWSQDTRILISSLLDVDKNLLPLEYKSINSSDVSAIKIDKKMNVSAITKSNIGPSLLHGIYPINRSPAKLDKYGRFTVKEIGKSAFAVPGKPPLPEVNFASKVVEKMFDDFGDLPWYEVVKGNELLNGLNKDSSNGFGCYKDKEYYINFETGNLTEECWKEINNFEKAVNDGTMTEEDWSKLFWVETPKDEVRNNSKEGVPRTFRVGTIIQQILAKRYFGRFVESVITSRDFNQVMVGINPIKEWPKIYEKLQKGKVFAGDVAKWDKGMVPEFQRALFDVIMRKYKGSQPKIAAMVLECLIHSLVIMMDDLYITTHSLASGHFLTAIFNSLINRMYTAGWYYRQLKTKGIEPQVYAFFSDVTDFVYGDDKLNAVMKHCDVLNAVTLRDYFESLGLGFTDASKKPIVEEFQDISEVSFLKRSFRYHDLLGKIVCPLELDVLQSGLSWVDYTKDVKLVLDCKIDNYQREIFLHPDRAELLLDFENRLKTRNMKLVKFPNSYLMELYSDESNYEPIFGSNLYL